MIRRKYYPPKDETSRYYGNIRFDKNEEEEYDDTD